MNLFSSCVIEIDKGASWFGRTCCPLPQSETCRRACITATSNADLLQGCRQSDEIEFFNCLERQEVGESCCSLSRTDDCLDSCLDIFKAQLTPTKQQRNLVEEACSDNLRVLNCVKNFTKVTPATNTQKCTLYLPIIILFLKQKAIFLYRYEMLRQVQQKQVQGELQERDFDFFYAPRND